MLTLPAAAQYSPQYQEPKPRVPRPSPEFQIEMVDGSRTLLSSFKGTGKVVCVEFLLTTCPHCQATVQILNRMYQEFGPRGFQPIGVAVNDMAKMVVPDFVKQFNVKFPVGYSARPQVYNYLELPTMLMLTVPRIVFIDKKFTIAAQHVGGDEFFKSEEANMRAMISSLLGAAKAPAKAPVKKAS